MLENQDDATAQTAAEQSTAEGPAEAAAEPGIETPETDPSEAGDGRGIDAILGVKLDVRVVLGSNRMPVSELLNLTKGSVIELDRKVGEPVDVMINDRVIARGDLIKVNDDMIGVALREIVKDFVPGL